MGRVQTSVGNGRVEASLTRARAALAELQRQIERLDGRAGRAKENAMTEPRNVFKVEEPLRFAFDGMGGNPFFLLKNGKWPCRVPIRPAAGYSHDLDLVEAEFAHSLSVFKLDLKPHLFILQHDSPDGLNGQMIALNDWGGGTDQYHRLKMKPNIILYGKPIPLHPAMTRYLVAHEYGHAVAKHLAFRMGMESDDTELMRSYAQMRGMKLQEDDHYGPGTWHQQPGEVFANDFRIIVAEREAEFWPHPEIEHAEKVMESNRAVREFWQAAIKYGQAAS